MNYYLFFFKICKKVKLNTNSIFIDNSRIPPLEIKHSDCTNIRHCYRRVISTTACKCLSVSFLQNI